MRDDFGVFILTHGRPDRVYTYKSLTKGGYTGKRYLVVDNLDTTLNEYKRRYGNEVIVFDKAAEAKTTDIGDNTKDLRGVTYARNTCFKLARKLRLKYFMELDDDYVHFAYLFNSQNQYSFKMMYSLDRVLDVLLDFYIKSGALSIAIAQGGDLIGGKHSQLAKTMTPSRKVMNTFICSVDRPFNFLGRINEDTTTYVNLGNKGNLFLSLPNARIQQLETQQNPGGLTDYYLSGGTYLKSFYSVMYNPASVKVGVLNTHFKRVHHIVSWDNTAPKIIRANYG